MRLVVAFRLASRPLRYFPHNRIPIRFPSVIATVVGYSIFPLGMGEAFRVSLCCSRGLSGAGENWARFRVLAVTELTLTKFIFPHGGRGACSHFLAALVPL